MCKKLIYLQENMLKIKGQGDGSIVLLRPKGQGGQGDN